MKTPLCHPAPFLLMLGCLMSSVTGFARDSSGRRFLITDFGAIGDGTTLNTKAIQRAIDTAAKTGGVVEIPKGTFLSGSIFLKPGVGLHLDQGAVLLGSTNIADYPKRETRIEGHFTHWRMALVNAQHLDGVRITGAGILDGNGVPFWREFWQARRKNPKVTNLAVERPRLMFIDRCRHVRISGLRLQNSGFWNLHLYACRDVLVEGLRITLPSAQRLHIRGPSTDGIDVDSSQNVTIRKCYISTDDDDIVLKGSKGPFAARDTRSPPVENILVEDVEVGNGNGLLTCGSEATVIRNVTVRNCTLTGNATMLTLKLRPDTPQHYEHITLENITLKGRGRLINVAPWRQFFNLEGQPPPTQEVNDITLRNIHGTYGAFGVLRANPGDVLKNFTFENIDVRLRYPMFRPAHVQHFVIRHVIVNGKPLVLPGEATDKSQRNR